jgi:crotonobetainyl-CoA:carnitine CoA-transferase CaiB-like acyl-CoA transferase
MMDPQIQALESIVTVQDEDLGALKMQNAMFRTSETPGAVNFAGRRLGQDVWWVADRAREYR